MLVDTTELDPILSGLSVTEIEDLVLQYCFSKHSVTTLIQAFKLNCEPRKLLNALPFITSDFSCPYCEQKMVRKILSKSSKLDFDLPFCQKCMHIESKKCLCFHCKKKDFLHQDSSLNKSTIFKYLKQHDFKYTPQSFLDLSLKDALYLSSLLRSSSIILSTGHVGSITNIPPLAPYETDVVFNHLVSRRLITLSLNTTASAFNIEGDKVKSVDLTLSEWKVHLKDFESTLLQLNDTIENSTWPLKWHYDVKTIWLEIAVLECIEYLQHVANKRCFNIEITDKLKNNFLTLLRNHSISECFAHIDDSARETSDKLVKNTICKSNTGNSFIKCCFQNHESPSLQKEESRPYSLPQSQLSYVFFHDFLKNGDSGFTTIACSHHNMDLHLAVTD